MASSSSKGGGSPNPAPAPDAAAAGGEQQQWQHFFLLVLTFWNGISSMSVPFINPGKKCSSRCPLLPLCRLAVHKREGGCAQKPRPLALRQPPPLRGRGSRALPPAAVRNPRRQPPPPPPPRSRGWLGRREESLTRVNVPTFLPAVLLSPPPSFSSYSSSSSPGAPGMLIS